MSKSSTMRAMMALTMLAATTGNLFDSDRPKPKRKLKHNETKKCFKADCTNHRTGDSLYCSDECQQVYHKYLKDKESQS